MIFVYRRNPSTSARSLATAVEGRRWRRAAPQPPRAGDLVICWGEAAPPVPPGVIVLNGAPIVNKFTDAERLRAAGVPTIEVSRTRPVAPPAVPTTDPAIAAWDAAQDLAGDFVEIETFARNQVMTRGVQQLIDALMVLNGTLGRPIPSVVPTSNDVWIPRTFNHVGGNDLLAPPATPDYYSKKVTLQEEYRIHSFDSRSIRAGRKVLRDGYTVGAPGTPAVGSIGIQVASTWIRSFDAGWRINYDGFESSRALRELAASAITALGLQFGAVDIGATQDGRLIVLEVNRAPGIEGGSLTAYAGAITRYVAEHGTAEARRAA